MVYGIFYCDSMKQKVILYLVTMKYVVIRIRISHVWSATSLLGIVFPEIRPVLKFEWTRTFATQRHWICLKCSGFGTYHLNEQRDRTI